MMRTARNLLLWAFAAHIALSGAAQAAPEPAPASAQAAFDRQIDETKSVMMESPQRALTLARNAEATASRLPAESSALAAARAKWLQGEALSRLDRTNEALPMLDEALATVARVAPADRLHGDVLLSRGWVHEVRGRIAAGLGDFQQAFTIYRAAGEPRGEAKALQNIAGVYQDAGDHPRAQRFYAQAAETYHGDPAFALAAYNNVGESLRLLGRPREAEKQYELALAAARKSGSPLLQANIITNLASTHLLRGDPNGATRLTKQALDLSADGEAADERPFVWGVMAQIAAARGDTVRAAELIGRTFEGVDLKRSSLRYRDFHKLAADIYAREHRAELALRHLRAWKRLDDDVRAVAASTNAALMAAKFDFSTQNLRIATMQADRARLHETVLIIVVAAISLISALLLAGILSLRRSRNTIRDTNRDLTKALQAKSDFLAMTSHEIRTPLNGILGMTQVILADRNVAEPLRARVKVVHGAGETMRALVDDILDLSKMESGKLEVHRTPVRLPTLLDEAVRLWRVKAEAKGLSLTLDIDACPSAIEEDGDRLRQIVFNLLSNAVKFTEHGHVSLKAAAVDGGLEMTVIDTGIGIAAEHHELIFEKFQQADGSTSRRFGGTGLGLAICRNLAGAMDGTITVDSRLENGSCFTLRLPLRVIEAPLPAEAAKEAAAVLLLEPNALKQRMLAKGLRAAFGAVEAVSEPAALIERVERSGATHLVVQASAAGGMLPEILAKGQGCGARVTVLFSAEDGVEEADLIGAGAVPVRKPAGEEALIAAMRGEPLSSPLAAAA